MYSLSPSSDDVAGDFELSDLPELGRDDAWPADTEGVIMAVAYRMVQRHYSVEHYRIMRKYL